MASSPKRKKTKIFVTPWFGECYRELLANHPEIRSAMTVFNRSKRANPPITLPPKMKDHSLKGRLAAYRECHLASDILLIYTHEDGVLSFLHICEHDDLSGGKEASLARRIRSALN